MIRRRRFFLVILLALVAPVFIARGDDSPKYAPMPWHLVDIWWDLGKPTDFESYSVDVTVSDDVPDDVNLYIAPIGLGKLSGSDFYGGIQTNSDGRTKTDAHERNIGRGLIFSMWGQRSFDAIRPAEGGWCQSSGNEGDYVSVRRAYAWKKGKYTYRLAKMDREVVDGQPYTWVGAFVYSHERDENIFIGALRFKGDKLSLDQHVASFVEIYGRLRPVTDIPKVTVTYDNFRLNGESAHITRAEAIYGKKIPDFADVSAKEQGATITIGKPVEGREKRKVVFIGEK